MHGKVNSLTLAGLSFIKFGHTYVDRHDMCQSTALRSRDDKLVTEEIKLTA